MDAPSYLDDAGGPGPFAYILLATSPLVKGFFERAISGQISGTLTAEHVRSALGITSNSDRSYNNAYVAVNDPNYVERTFVWGHVRYEISGQFVADGENSRIEGLRLQLLNDDFDFVSAGLAETNNILFLRQQIAPYTSGTSFASRTEDKAVQLPADEDGLGGQSITLTYADYRVREQLAAQITTSSPYSGFEAGQQAVEQLRESGTIDYDRADGTTTVYGTYKSETLAARHGLKGGVIVGGGGDDKIYGSGARVRFTTFEVVIMTMALSCLEPGASVMRRALIW